MKQIKLLVPLLFASLPFGQLNKLPGLPVGVNVYFFDLIIIAILIISLPALKKLQPRSLLKPLAYFIAIALLSLIVNYSRYTLEQLLISSLYLFRFITYALLAVVFYQHKHLPLKSYLLNFSLALSTFGLIQYLFVPDVRFLASLNFDDHYYRIVATLGDPSFVGLIAVLGLILAYFNKFPKWHFLIFFPTLLLTYSRSSYLALLVAIVAFTIIRKQFKLLIFGLLLVAVLPFLPRPGGDGVKLERTFSAFQRAANTQEGLLIVKDNPVLGIGFNALRYYRDTNIQSHADAGLDNSFVFVAATTGLLGLIAFIYLLIHLFSLGPLMTVSLIAILTHSLFQNSIFYPHIMIWIWTLSATSKLKST